MKISHQSGCWGPFLLLLTAAITCAALPLHWATAHEGDRVYPILEITDDMLAQIDLRDGTTDEWPDLLGEPTLKTIDFEMDDFSYDPSDLDFAVWLGWHEELDRIYFAGAFVDDVYLETVGSSFRSYRDYIQLTVDGDHSPERASIFSEEGRFRNKYQSYWAAAMVPEGPIMIFPLISDLGDWMLYPPYADGEGSVVGEQPAIWSMEFFVTPFDLLMALEPDSSVVSDLTAGEVIGFGVRVSDSDQTGEANKWYNLFGADVMLLSQDQTDSVVRDRTWGRIKAALEIDR